MKIQYGACASICALMFLATTILWADPPEDKTDASTTDTQMMVPVETDMHELMEYVFQPPYKRLKSSLASEPADKKAWKSIKSDSLILAEAGNLLLMHVQQDGGEDWAKHSTQVRDAGGLFYKASKKRDFAAARKNYETMIQNCNACHTQFANGKHILKP